MKKAILTLLILYNSLNIHCYNINIFGFVNTQDGIGQVSYSFIECLSHLPELRFIQHWPSSIQDLDSNMKNIIKRASEIYKCNTKNDITIYTNAVSSYKEEELAIPSLIKLAYSMTECTKLQDNCVQKINKYFDAVIVPDEYYIKVYKYSGIAIPIFVLPLSLDLNLMLKQPNKSMKNKIFTFGYSAGFGISKNYDLLIDAFNIEFGTNINVRLKLHGLAGYYLDAIKNKIKNSPNIFLDNFAYSKYEYMTFLKSLDCYVTFSKGEGFSITPREAMALAIPCIVSNNTAHKTICNSCYVYSVESSLIEPHTADGKEFCGFDFNCSSINARRALKYVYENYNVALKKAINAREWVKQYLPDQLRAKYLNLFFPKKILLGDFNIITNDYLMTNSIKLFKKYKSIRYK